MQKKKRRRGRGLVTLHDVAKHAGVSAMTVSRFIGGKPNIRDAARVKQAIDELGYSPNSEARNLASAGALKVGLLYGNPSATFNSELLVGLVESGSQAGCQLLLEKWTGARSQRATASRLIERGLDGVILPTPMCDSAKLLAQFEDAGIATVALGTGRDDLAGLAVRIDNFQASEQMTEYLLSQGHREIGFIIGHPKQIDSQQRYDGFLAAMNRASLTPHPSRVKQGFYTYQSGFSAAEELLKENEPPTAIFASNDDMAAGALGAAHRMKLEVPRDLSIVGFDDTPLASAIWPALTTVRQPVSELTGVALSLLLEEIRRRRAGERPSRREELVMLALVMRDSVAPVRVRRGS